MKVLRACAALCALIMLASACGGANSSGHTALSGVLPFPADRALSALQTAVIDGKATAQRSPGASDAPNGASLIITGAAQPEWAIYTFNPKNAPNQITVTVDGAQTSAYWIAQADYTALRWRLDGPFASTQSFPLSAANLSPLGNVSVGILAPAGESVQVDMLQLSFNNDAPVADIQATPTTGASPVQVDFYGGASTDNEGAITKYEWEFQTGGGFTSTGSTPTTSHIYNGAGNYTARLRVTDEGGLVGFDTIQITVTPPLNQPPNAVLTAPAKAAAPQMAIFDASGSNDPDGTIVNYRWDLDNDGVFNEPGSEANEEGNAQVTVPAANPGTYTISVEVTDNTGGLGGVDTATATFIATGWKIFTLSDQGDEAGRLNDLKVINGKPAIAFQLVDSMQNPTRSLIYASASTATGSNFADWTFVTTPAFINGGNAYSLCEVNGTPAISCYGGPTQANSFRMTYVRSSTPTGSSSSDWTVLQPQGGPNNGFGFSSSLAIINGHPAIAYQGPDEDTCYVYSNTVDGMSAADWTAPIIIDGTGGSSGGDVSLCELAGSPAIAYRDNVLGTRVKFARANSATGATAGSWTGPGSSFFDLESSNGFYPCMAVINGKPAVAYWKSTTSDLRYAVSSTASGAAFADWTFVNADGGADEAGGWPSLCQFNGVPVIAHQAQGAELDLEVTAASTPTGSMQADWPADSSKVDTVGDVGSFCHIADVNGFAAISYYDNTNFALKYAVLFQ